MILFLSLATSGLIDRKQPLDSPSQPFILSITAELCNAELEPLDHAHLRVRAPEGRKVSIGATNVNGITNRQAAVNGINEIAALSVLCGLASQSLQVVGHGIEFDRDVAVGRLMALGKSPRQLTRAGLEWVDTMKTAAHFCKIESGNEDGNYKWPSLNEACQHILGYEPEGNRSAWDNLQRAKMIYTALHKQGAFEVAA